MYEQTKRNIDKQKEIILICSQLKGKEKTLNLAIKNGLVCVCVIRVCVRVQSSVNRGNERYPEGTF